LPEAEKVSKAYGHENKKPSKYEKTLRGIFAELDKCDSITLKNENSKTILAQSGINQAQATKDSKPEEHFKMVKHPDQKKYMHYALQNSEGQWLHWDDKSGLVQAGPKLSWFAMLPANEKEWKNSGWLIKQDKFYLSMPDQKDIKASKFDTVPKARDNKKNRWGLSCNKKE